jgi:hypothetical protein
MYWIHLAQDTAQWRVLENEEINLRVPLKTRSVYTNERQSASRENSAPWSEFFALCLFTSRSYILIITLPFLLWN